MSFEVIYMTGPPAVGKTTLCKALRDAIPNVCVFEYGAELTKHVSERSALTQAELRTESASIVAVADVKAVDEKLLAFVKLKRKKSHVIIDSHAVTKETYGFRITPFKLDQFANLAPTQIWMLYVTSEETLSRILAAPEGRPTITPSEAAFHLELQSSVAIMYGMHVGVSINVINTELPVEDLVKTLGRRFTK